LQENKKKRYKTNMEIHAKNVENQRVVGYSAKMHHLERDDIGGKKEGLRGQKKLRCAREKEEKTSFIGLIDLCSISPYVLLLLHLARTEPNHV
jgi:hypothetical protein